MFNPYDWFKPVLFSQDPEAMHHFTIGAIERAACMPGFETFIRGFFKYDDPRLQTSLWGLHFPNPLGVAAGFDKDGRIFNPLLALGFGFVELGTVTPRPQPGNPQPRLFRLIEDEAVINRLGFNNAGAQALAQRLQQRPPRGIIGINLGKNKETPLEQAAEDYDLALRAVYAQAHYLVVNVSSPNTAQLRQLQEKEALRELLQRLLATRNELIAQGQPRLPLLVKIAPDLTDEALDELLELSLDLGLDGVIATNTTLRREGLRNASLSQETGGLSGAPLRSLSTEIIRKVYRRVQTRLPIIGVGGISTGDHAYEKIRAGASLVQLYTGFIYRGPATVQLAKCELVKLLERDGLRSVSEAIGLDAMASA